MGTIDLSLTNILEWRVNPYVQLPLPSLPKLEASVADTVREGYRLPSLKRRAPSVNIISVLSRTSISIIFFLLPSPFLPFRIWPVNWNSPHHLLHVCSDIFKNTVYDANANTVIILNSEGDSLYIVVALLIEQWPLYPFYTYCSMLEYWRYSRKRMGQGWGSDTGVP